MPDFLRSQNRRLFMVIATLFFLGLAFIIGNNVKNSTVAAATTYTTTTVRLGEVEALVSGMGRLGPISEVELSFPLEGLVAQVQVQSGQAVQQGQTLARLDSRELELSATAAQASLKQAQARLEGVRTGSAKDLATAQAVLRQTQTRLQLARNGNVSPEDVQAAQAAINQAQSLYNNLLNKPNPKDAQAAEATLRQARAKLEQAKSGPSTQSVQAAEAELEASKQNQNKVNSATNATKEQARISQEQTQRTFDTAKAAFDKIYSQNHNPDGTPKANLPPADQEAEKAAKNALDDARNNLDKAKSAYADAQTQAEAGQKEAQSKVDQAQANLDKVKALTQTQQNEVAAAQAEVDRAQAALDKARQGSSKDELDAAQAEITSAKARLEKLNKNAVNEKEVALIQSEVDKAQSSVDNLSRGASAAELNGATAAVEEADALYKRAQLRLNQTVLTAPFSGVVGPVKLVVGQTASPNLAVLTLLDLSNFKAELTVPENDIARVKIGQTARLSLEFIPELSDLRGRVSTISPAATTLANNVTGYKVTMLIDRPTKAESDLLFLGVKPGMSGNIRLVVERKSAVLVIPRKSIKNLGDTQVVEVLSNGGQLITVPVTLGVKGENEVEVMEPSLLLPGDQIVVAG